MHMNRKSIPLCFSHTLDKKERKTMIRATPAMSPIRMASVFSISSSLWLLSSTLFVSSKKIGKISVVTVNIMKLSSVNCCSKNFITDLTYCIKCNIICFFIMFMPFGVLGLGQIVIYFHDS